MGLKKVGETYLTSDTQNLVVTGIEEDNCTYIFVYQVSPTNNGDNGRVRFTKTSNSQGAGNSSYDKGLQRFSYTGNSTTGTKNVSYCEMEDQNYNLYQCNGIMVLHNFYDSGQYSMMHVKQTQMANTNVLIGMDASFQYKVNESHNGIIYYYPVGQVKEESYGILYKVV